MRNIILIGLVFFSWGATHLPASAAHADTTAVWHRVPLAAGAVAQLGEINHWLDQNIRASDCPDRQYYALLEEHEQNAPQGYEIVADCPDAPIPTITLLFDREQRYVEPGHFAN